MSPRRSPYGWVVEGLLTFATFCSLIVLVAGFLTKVDPWTAGGRSGRSRRARLSPLKEVSR